MVITVPPEVGPLNGFTSAICGHVAPHAPKTAARSNPSIVPEPSTSALQPLQRPQEPSTSARSTASTTPSPVTSASNATCACAEKGATRKPATSASRMDRSCVEGSRGCVDDSLRCGLDSAATGPRRAPGSAGAETGNSGEQTHGVLATRKPKSGESPPAPVRPELPGVVWSRKEERTLPVLPWQ